MKFISFLVSVSALTTSAVAQYTNATNTGDIDHVTVFTAPRNYTVPRTLYARSVLLNQNCEKDNVILATWENYGPNNNTNPYFPIYQSLDGGHSWSERSRVYDQVNGWGLRYQPFLYELSQPIGNLSAGTILLAGSSIPQDLSETQLELYASTDKGCVFMQPFNAVKTILIPEPDTPGHSSLTLHTAVKPYLTTASRPYGSRF
jgi:hypothetical protein